MNGLRIVSQLMVDKITTVSKTKLERRVGRLADADIMRLNRAVLVFLGLAASRRECVVQAEAVSQLRKLVPDGPPVFDVSG